jgi:hypothetical protein
VPSLTHQLLAHKASVSTGKQADLILVKENSLVHLATLILPCIVIINGSKIDRKQLDLLSPCFSKKNKIITFFSYMEKLIKA